MLSKTFKSAEELGVPEDFYDALVQVYWMLVDEKIPANLFNMGTIGNPRLDDQLHPCGTEGCLLGWASAIGRIRYDDFYYRFPGFKELDALFYPGRVVKGGYNATREQSARALLGYLTTGRHTWKEVMKR